MNIDISDKVKAKSEIKHMLRKAFAELKLKSEREDVKGVSLDILHTKDTDEYTATVSFDVDERLLVWIRPGYPRPVTYEDDMSRALEFYDTLSDDTLSQMSDFFLSILKFDEVFRISEL